MCDACCSGVFIVNFEHISQPVLLFLLLSMHLFAGMTVYFIFFSACYIFSLMKNERVRTCLDFPVCARIFAVDFK